MYWKRWFKKVSFLFVFLNFKDAIITLICVQIFYLHELNPFVENFLVDSPATFIIVKILFPIAIVFFFYNEIKIRKPHNVFIFPDSSIIPFRAIYLSTIFYTLVVVNNIFWLSRELLLTI